MVAGSSSNPLESIQGSTSAAFVQLCLLSVQYLSFSFSLPLPGYVYAVKGKDVYVNLFMSNTSNLKVEGKAVSLEQATHYPWNGDVTIGVNKNNAGQFTMKIRIPGWVRNQVVPSDLYTYSDGKRLSYTVKVNGEPVQSELKDGYFCIDRRWKKEIK